MITTISLSTAAALTVAGVLLHLRAKGRSRLAYLLLVVAGFGVMASDVGSLVRRLTGGATTFLHDATGSEQVAAAVPTVIAVAALGIVGWAIVDGRGSLVTAALALALPTLFWSLDGPFYDAAIEVVRLVESLIWNLTGAVQNGIETGPVPAWTAESRAGTGR